MKKLPFLIIFVFYLFQTAKAETEPNDNSSQANLLILNNTQDGTLTGTDVDDWFVLAVPQGGILNITVHKTGGGNARIYLLDADKVGFPEITNLYLGYSDSPPEGWILSYPVLPGNYYVHFFRYDPSVSYSVTPAVAPSSFGQDIEPNHVSADAQVISSTGAVGGTLRYYRPNEGTDIADWFKMLVPQGGILNLKIHKTGPGNTWFRMRDAETPNFPEISNFYAGYGQSPTEGWNWSFPVLAGDYYFQVEEGEYWLDYKIEAALAAPIWGEDIEPNDSLNLAQNAPINGTIPGLMGYYQPGSGYDNWDWFVLNAPENGLLSFQISKTGYQNGNVRIRNETAEIGTSYLGFSDQNTSFSQLVSAGKYYLGVEKYGGDFQYKVVSTLLPSPVAHFTFAQTGNVFAFENTTLHAASFVWKFDDGTTATTVNAYHEYKEPGNYEVCLIATNAAGADTICQAVIMPGVARALPAEGGNTGDVTLQVFGGGLDTNYVAKIMDGTTVIAASTFTDFGGKSSINVQFDLRNKPVGAYELRIEKPGGPSYTVPGGFKIVEGVAANPWVRISGRNRILFNTWTTYTIDYGNFGNVDASFVPIWLSFSKNPGLDVKFQNVKFIDPDVANPAPLAEDVFVELDSMFGQAAPSRVYPLILRKIPGGTNNSLTIKVKTSGDLKIKAWAESPWFQSPVDEAKASCLSEGLTAAPMAYGLNEGKIICAKTLFIFFAQEFVGDEKYEKPDDPQGFLPLIVALKSATKACGVTDSTDRKAISKWLTNIIINGWLDQIKIPAFSASADDRSSESCSAAFEPQNPSANTLTAVNSLDPNEKSGLAGFGPVNFLTSTRNFPYTIHFENNATASAPAHTVTITDTLDKVKFDLTSFNFGNVIIGDSILKPEPGLREFVLDKKLEHLGITARIHGKLDLQTGIVEWTFRSLDAVTLAEVEDPYLGFLPPNVQSPEGQGSVSFFIQLKNAPQDAEKIRNSASIVFDANAPIITNEHVVTFDLEAPESHVLPLPATTHEAQIPVSWEGTDAGSGLQFFNIYFSENNGADTIWLARTSATAATFNGKTGSSYRFYSIAVDNAGNAELAPTTPDAEISILVGTDNPLINTGLRVFPNPAKERIIFLFENTAGGKLTFSRPDGTFIYTENLRGEQQQEFSVVGWPNGVYYWKWADNNGGEVASGKVLVFR